MIELASGGLGGSAGILLGYPLDTVKANIQTGHKIRWHNSSFKIRSLYRGMTLPLGSAAFLNALMFGGYEGALRYAGYDDKQHVPMTTVVYQNKEGPLKCTKDIVRLHGFRGFYAGGKVMALRDLIGYAFYIPVYEATKKLVHNYCNFGTVLQQILSGGISGSLAWLVICPLELIKNRTQCDPKLTTVSVVHNVLKTSGVRGFFKGGLILTLRAFPVNAITFLVYEHTLQQFKQNKQ
ncbi:unnamed protein product [Bursaphelenchus okinawaensis]|uniref:Mitochondrial carrier protein n=1 Tax=Bursaphelenchus okinawaensis TaxID=465554 RepID=A0A811LB43_9BILA|nr:unnamed protein product [Bursaphelenchus okinawaensis]CAG9119840.1 unnamed protein product [Bursaphelenchus okinawaensis]